LRLGRRWDNIIKPVKNSANTSVLALDNRLLALWEGGAPHSLDLDTLSTKGIDNLAGTLGNLPFSAHPKVDPITGEIFNFGVKPGRKNTLYLHRCSSSGKVIKQGSFSLSGLPLIHDFSLAGDYLVFLIAPVRVNTLGILSGKNSYSDAMEWQPELGTQVLIFDRQDLSLVSKNLADPWYQWHYSNGYLNSDRQIVIESVRYSDFQTNEYLREVATGKIQTEAQGTLWQAIIDPQTARVIESRQLLDRPCEFPIVAPARVGQSWRYTYLNTHVDEQDRSRELFTAIARFDRHTGELAVSQMGENLYPSEPVYVAAKDDPSLSWLLTVVYNGNLERSEVWIYQSDRLEDQPVCRLELPGVIPHSFHGTWRAS
ncbi:MAG: carotenoid oxygenase family protein, partial [Cyanobacteria bacterium J06642_3]